MKYYVVSESELQDLVSTAEAAGQGFARGYEVDRDLEACRARPVPEWATHFSRIQEGPDEDGIDTLHMDAWEEIKR